MEKVNNNNTWNNIQVWNLEVINCKFNIAFVEDLKRFLDWKKSYESEVFDKARLIYILWENIFLVDRNPIWMTIRLSLSFAYLVTLIYIKFSSGLVANLWPNWIVQLIHNSLTWHTIHFVTTSAKFGDWWKHQILNICIKTKFFYSYRIGLNRFAVLFPMI